MRGLKGRVAVVTGGSRGIGLAIAQGLVREGAEVVLVARCRKALNLAKKKLGSKTSSVAADIAQPGDVERVFKFVKRRYGRLDVLVNSAGVFTYKPFSETTFDDWRRNIDSNLTSLFLTTKAALPLFEPSRHPHVVNILSVSSVRDFPNCSAYTAAKYGALGLTRVLREELRSQGIRVTAILPGLTDTRVLDAFGFEIPRNRVMQPKDVAETVIGALRQPARTAVEEVLLMPSSGAV